MSVRVGEPAPGFEAESYVRGESRPRTVILSEQRGQWTVLFFYPRDFTFICPTELAAFASRHDDFRRERTIVLGASTDSYHSHKAYFESDPRLADVRYPVIADTSHEVSRAYDVLLPDGATHRATFVIDPDGVVRHLSVTEHDVGRNVDEVLRIVRGFRTGALCPADWRPGDATLTTDNDWLEKAFPALAEPLLDDIAARAEKLSFDAGGTVIAEGDSADRFFVIVSGEVEITRRTLDGAEVMLGTLGPGQFFGEIGLLAESRRTATVRATAPLEVLALDWATFREVVESSDETGRDFAAIAQERLAA